MNCLINSIFLKYVVVEGKIFLMEDHKTIQLDNSIIKEYSTKYHPSALLVKVESRNLRAYFWGKNF